MFLSNIKPINVFPMVFDAQRDQREYTGGARSGQPWVIVLAGGSGQRMRGAIKQWYGRDIPKQFCNFVGSRSMLEHTWGRARRIVPESNIVTVAVDDHRKYFENLSHRNPPGQILYQPVNRGTAPAVYVALAHILAQDPEARVMVMPSDHFIYPESRFVDLAAQVIYAVKALSNRMLLMGAPSSWGNTDYGWVDIGDQRREATPDEYIYVEEDSLYAVNGFYEKPVTTLAENLYQQGALWSTMIFAARAKLLWKLGLCALPLLMERVEFLRQTKQHAMANGVGEHYIDMALSHAFYKLNASDFSSAIMQPNARKCLASPMNGVEWDDWGRPNRVEKCIERHGLRAKQSEKEFS